MLAATLLPRLACLIALASHPFTMGARKLKRHINRHEYVEGRHMEDGEADDEGVHSEGDEDPIACPVLSALKNAGHLTPDSEGRVTGPNMKAALMETGCSSTMSGFQADGIVGFWYEDVHQAERKQWPGSSLVSIYPLYGNLYTMNSMHACNGTYQNTVSGFPCNINTEFQQHGYSTRLRDPLNGRTPAQRFHDVFGQEGVLEQIAGVNEKVMTLAGLAKVLAQARASGDLSGEFSLNASGGFSGSKLEYFHPQFGPGTWNTYKAAAQWQAITAWSGFFLAFSRETNGVRYMTEGDLKSFFLSGTFPSDWQKQDWGFGSAYRLAPEFKGKGVGDEWIAMVEQTLESAGYDAWESTYFVYTTSMFYDIGVVTGDSNSNPLPAR